MMGTDSGLLFVADDLGLKHYKVVRFDVPMNLNFIFKFSYRMQEDT